jgi:hypothetical protein
MNGMYNETAFSATSISDGKSLTGQVLSWLFESVKKWQNILVKENSMNQCIF